jgi:cell division protein FtsL
MGKGVTIGFLILATISFISAVSTTINVETFSNHNIEVRVLEAGSVFTTIESFRGISDIDGKFSATLNTDGVDTMDIKVWVKKNNEIIVLKRFDGFIAGSPVSLEVYPDSYVKPVAASNSTKNETNKTNETLPSVALTTETEETTSSQKGITGLSTSEDTGKGGFLSKEVMYFFVGLIVIAGLFFLGIVAFKRKEYGVTKNIKDVKVKKLSDVQSEKKQKLDDYKKAIEEAENKISDAQKDINKLRNAGKIEDVKRRLIEDQRELLKLRGEE